MHPPPHPPTHPLALPPCSTFYRVWAFLILEFQLMACVLWGGWGNHYALSSLALTHAALSLMEQVAGAWTQRPVSELGCWHGLGC